MTSDYHIHTALCKHATGSMEEYVQQAIKIGLNEIAFTDHIPLPDEFDLAHRMHPSQIETYLSEIRKLQDKYPQISILCGIEADYYEGFENYLQDFLATYPFDIVIMSVHFIKGWPENNWAFSYYFPDKTLTQIYSEYLEAVLKGIQTGLFDIIGHLDLIKSEEQSLVSENSNQIIEILQVAKKKNMAIEINSSGLRKDIEETYPSFDILPLIEESGLPMTFGSDAHAPEQVGLYFNQLQNEINKFPKIKMAGFKNRNIYIKS